MSNISKTYFDDQPLADSAELCLELSKSYCTPECKSYHGIWVLSRLFGSMNSVRRNQTDFLEALKSAALNKKKRVLISGAADFGILSCVVDAYNQLNFSPEITVVDMCQTPLELNTWYAKRIGIEINVIKSNALEFEETEFDLVVGHNFLNFFSPENHQYLFDNWNKNLQNYGWVIISNKISPNSPLREQRFSGNSLEAFVENMLQERIAQGYQDLISSTELEELIRDFANKRYSWRIQSFDNLIAKLNNSKFELVSEKRSKLAKSHSKSPKESYKCTLTLQKTSNL